jgi:hypothetical protein
MASNVASVFRMRTLAPQMRTVVLTTVILELARARRAVPAMAVTDRTVERRRVVTDRTVERMAEVGQIVERSGNDQVASDPSSLTEIVPTKHVELLLSAFHFLLHNNYTTETCDVLLQPRVIGVVPCSRAFCCQTCFNQQRPCIGFCYSPLSLLS